MRILHHAQMSVPTDCDQRDERLGWMGDADLSVQVSNTKGYSSTDLAMGFANVRAGTLESTNAGAGAGHGRLRLRQPGRLLDGA